MKWLRKLLGLDKPRIRGEYRVIRVKGGYEPQLSYNSGHGGLFWFPLREDGYWSDPDAYSHGDIKIHPDPMSREIAERAVLRAKAINGVHIRG